MLLQKEILENKPNTVTKIRMVWDVHKFFIRRYFIQCNSEPLKMARENTNYFRWDLKKEECIKVERFGIKQQGRMIGETDIVELDKLTSLMRETTGSTFIDDWKPVTYFLDKNEKMDLWFMGLMIRQDKL